MARKNLTMKALFALSALLFIGCAGIQFNPINPPAVHAATPASMFNGRYIFRSELHTVNAATPFVEGGVIDADGNGNIVATFTTYNQGGSYITSPNAASRGTYTLDSSGFGTISLSILSGSFWMVPEHMFCQLSGDYCTVVSSEPGRSWQGKLWKDKSTTTASTLSGSYIFESDGSLNQFAESGIISFSANGNYTLASIYNVALNPSVSNLTSPTPAFTCGVITPMSYYGQPAIFNASQGQCPSIVGFDEFAMYCFLDGSFCILVPHHNGGGWIAEMRRQ